jgi:hypothetical protein
MSEYQYYEFVAIDRPLTREQMSELRGISSRAEITPTRFTNTYNYGDFRGDEQELLERYFDAHVYIANWGSHILMFGLPLSAVDVDALQAYGIDGGFGARVRGDRVILTFEKQDQDGGGAWVDEDEGPAWMASLVSLRADLIRGDLRAAYLGWLRGAQDEGYIAEDEESGGLHAVDEDDDEDLEGEDLEPPVPPGLGSLSAPLQELVRFLEIDEDLVAVAAEASETLKDSGPSEPDLRKWIGALPPADKDALLLRVLRGDVRLQPELLRRFRQETGSESAGVNRTSRTIGQLLKASESRTTERKQREAEAAAKERKRRAEEAARAREVHLKSLEGREGELWLRVEEHIGRKQQNEYDRAVELLRYLRELAERAHDLDEFGSQLRAMRDRHHSKSSFIRRLDAARFP